MAEDEAILFCGDPLAFVSRHYFPALMHRPAAVQMLGHAPTTRLATPFFLYPDEEAVLDSTRTRHTPHLAEGMTLYELEPPLLPVTHFKLNVGSCRDLWPWKRMTYYKGLVICRDSDSFPEANIDDEDDTSLLN